jgi:subtilase family serine protease
VRHRHLSTALVTLGLGLAAPAGAALAATTPAGRTVVQSLSRAATPTAELRATPASTAIDFNVGLQPTDAAGATTLAQEVSDPSSPSYRHYLTPAGWESRFSPSKSAADAVRSWLKSEGIAVEEVTPDRLTIQASGTAAAISHAFGVGLGEYRRAGRVVRLASASLTVPSSIAALISGVSGVDQELATHDGLTGAARRGAVVAKSGAPIPQPEGFRNAPPCSTYFKQAKDTTDPAYGGGYPALTYAPCGYTPPQLQGAYDLSAPIAGGIDGNGVTVAIVDAYASPTLLADAQQYASKNQPTQPLASGQYSQVLSKSFNEVEACEASEWFGEQTLDVEAVHATAPGANILYMGAKNCDTGLYNSVQQVVDGHLAQIITDSWGDDGGDLLDSAGSRRSFDNVLLMAIGTGIGVQFSAGDDGDEFTTLGFTAADYPPSSPYDTAVGGSSLEVNKKNARSAELGWSTSKSELCTPLLEELEEPGCSTATLNTWLPAAPGAYDYGGGGGTSYEYPEPSYQVGVVPAALAERNSAITGIANRVEPDISMDADPTTGMLVGETQTFPDGTYYDQYRIGGTSLSSPLFAGVMADADQAAGGPLGFVNPLLYSLDSSKTTAAGAFYDVKSKKLQALVREDYLDGVDAEEGMLTSVRTLNYEGPEEFCSGTGNCTHQNVALNTGKGFDSMTGIGTPGPSLLTELAAPAP